MTDRDELTAGGICGEKDALGNPYEQPIEFTCRRPRGHAAPHRDRSPGGEHEAATAWEWWPEKWWGDDG